jgi:hypothetical protein
MDKENIIIEMIKDFKNENDKNFDKLEKEIMKLKIAILNI